MKKIIAFLSLILFSYGEDVWHNPYKIEHSQTFLAVKDYFLNAHKISASDERRLMKGSFKIFRGERLENIPEKDISLSLFRDGEKISVENASLTRKGVASYQFAFKTPPNLKDEGWSLMIEGSQFQFKDPEPIEFENSGVNFIFILDASGSMAVNDAEDKRVKEMNKTIDFYKEVLGYVSVVSFATDVQILWDWKKVRDIEKFRKTVAEKFRVYGSTNIGLTFSTLYQYLQSKGLSAAQSRKTKIIFLTDGNSSDVYKGEHTKFKKMGVSVYTIGFGPKGNYNEAFLRGIAQESGGRFFSASEFNIGDIYQAVFRDAKLETRNVFYRRELGNEELVLLKFSSSIKDFRMILGGEEKQALYEEKKDSQRILYFPPLPLGFHEGYFSYFERGKMKREKINFTVKKVKKDFLFKENLDSMKLAENASNRMPFALKNTSNFLREYRLFVLGGEESAGDVLLREKNLLLEPGKMESFSLEGFFKKGLEKNFNVYLVVEEGGRFYPFDVSFKKLTRPLSILHFSEANQSEANHSFYLLAGLVLLLILFGTYVHVVKKAKKNVFL